MQDLFKIKTYYKQLIASRPSQRGFLCETRIKTNFVAILVLFLVLWDFGFGVGQSPGDRPSSVHYLAARPFISVIRFRLCVVPLGCAQLAASLKTPAWFRNSVEMCIILELLRLCFFVLISVNYALEKILKMVYKLVCSELKVGNIRNNL